MRAARDARRGIVWGLGAHVIKTGLAPVLIDLMERGFVSALATNGAGVIHDFELALSGSTSEDVDEALGPGRFGMAEETGRLLNARHQRRRRARPGPRPGGRRVARRASARHRRRQRPRRGGAARDPGHRPRRHRHRHHPHASGRVRRRDRRGQPARLPLLRLERRAARAAACYLNCGSAVVLPEVFLKAVALARNRGVARRADHREPRLHPALPAADQRRLPARRRHRQAAIRSSATTRS